MHVITRMIVVQITGPVALGKARILRMWCLQAQRTAKRASPIGPFNGQRARRPSDFMCPISGSMALRRRSNLANVGVRAATPDAYVAIRHDLLEVKRQTIACLAVLDGAGRFISGHCIRSPHPVRRRCLLSRAALHACAVEGSRTVMRSCPYARRRRFEILLYGDNLGKGAL